MRIARPSPGRRSRRCRRRGRPRRRRRRGNWDAARHNPARRRRARASAPPCCRACRRRAGAGGRPAPRRAPRRRAGRPRSRSGPRLRRRRRARPARSYPQALHDPAVLEMLLDDLVDVGLVHVGVPDLLRIHHDAGAFLAAVEAAGLVDAHGARARKAELLDALLGVVAQRARALVVAAGLAVLALVAAEEYVLVVVAHEDPGGGRRRLFRRRPRDRRSFKLYEGGRGSAHPPWQTTSSPTTTSAASTAWSGMRPVRGGSTGRTSPTRFAATTAAPASSCLSPRSNSAFATPTCAPDGCRRRERSTSMR